MPSSSSASTSASGFRRLLLWAILIFGLLMALLFRNSFVPELTVFSNDGPLGAISAASGELPSGFFGVWSDLNWIGTRGIGAAPNLSSLWAWVAKPVLFSKTYPPLALFLVGFLAWFMLRQFGFKPPVCILGGIAAMLNSGVFSIACWGLPAWSLARAMIFLALGILASQRIRSDLVRAALTGLAVGMGVMEGFDVGAINSLYVAAWVVFLCWTDPDRPPASKITRGIVGAGLVAFFAAFIATQSLSALVSTQVQGVTGTNQDTRTKEERWDWATQWSLPKIETLRVIVPGLFGYRMDTPDGGNYWGQVGRQPGWEQHHQGLPRHSGSGEYAGILVVLVAFWALFQSLRGERSPFPHRQRQFVWFWSCAGLISLLLAFGRHAPFYQIVYHLPYFSTIRNPIKFMNPLHVSLLILFGYGLEDLFNRYIVRAAAKKQGLKEHLLAWWHSSSNGDKPWAKGLLIFLGLAVGAFLLYSASRSELERYLTTQAFDAAKAKEISGFSIGELGRFVFFLWLSAAAILLILSGWLSGARGRWAAGLLGVLLVTDFARANQPWIIYYNYRQKYASNGVLEALRAKPYENRTASRLSPMSPTYLVTSQMHDLFSGVTEEWLQQHYPFYNIQSLDIVQMPRVPEMDAAYMGAIFSSAFSTSDILNLAGLVAKLTNQADAVSQFLWERFPPASRAVLVASAASPNAAEVLKEELNRMVRSPSLYEPTRFAGVKLSDETRGFLNPGAQPRDLTRFHRLLLQDAYPTELAHKSQLASFARLWQLTNTRLILGMGGFLDIVNQEMDPEHRSFRVLTSFDFLPRDPGTPPRGVEDITATVRPGGQFAIFEFGAALPRAKLFTNWRVMTNNDQATLELLAERTFDPNQQVLVAHSLPPGAPPPSSTQNPGTVSIASYQPKHIRLEASGNAPAILLLNDKIDPNWTVTVDGKPATLLRCNYIMQGVFLPAGAHQVSFDFKPPHWTFYVSLGAIGVGLVMCGLVAFGSKPPGAEAAAGQVRAGNLVARPAAK